MTTVVLADDHKLIRDALRRQLETEGLTVVAEAQDGEEAVRVAEEHRPDVVVMDVSMPVLDGIQATKMLHQRAPGIRILVLTMHGELNRDAINAGASGFLTKDSPMTEIVEAVKQVATGETLMSPTIASRALDELRTPEPTKPDSPLTSREEEILQCVADGKSTSEIAAELFISAKTVKNHLASIYDKLDARDRTQAVLSGVRIGIVQIR
ncbi:MAG: response regulator [Acidimicrobiia bacterium]